jgi:hypothetical protein
MGACRDGSRLERGRESRRPIAEQWRQAGGTVKPSGRVRECVGTRSVHPSCAGSEGLTGSECLLDAAASGRGSKVRRVIFLAACRPAPPRPGCGGVRVGREAPGARGPIAGPGERRGAPP